MDTFRGTPVNWKKTFQKRAQPPLPKGFVIVPHLTVKKFQRNKHWKRTRDILIGLSYVTKLWCVFFSCAGCCKLMFSGCLMQGPCGNDTGPFNDSKNQPSFELTLQDISLLFSTSARPRRSRISKRALAHWDVTHSEGDWVMEGESGGSFLPPLYTEWHHWYNGRNGWVAVRFQRFQDEASKQTSWHAGVGTAGGDTFTKTVDN